jgi:hypothetical protein
VSKEVLLKDDIKLMRGSPAGRPSDTRGQQPSSVLVLNARDERAIAWLIDQAGFDAVQQACDKIAGKRKAYPTNLAKILGLSIPQYVVVTPVAEARDRVRDLLVLLSSNRK